MRDAGGDVLVSGIKPTGTPHLGNLVGMLEPAARAAGRYESFLFIADLHALTTLRRGPELRDYVYDGVAALLAVDVDPRQVAVFRQSDVPHILEVAWVLACLTPVPLLERAHAFKAAMAEGDQPNVGLFSYPILMASDILALGGTVVPVGRDQLQHLEMARDVARRFNHAFGATLSLPRPLKADSAAALPGLDGRKMSKRYGNTIPLSASPRQRRSLVAKIVTDSSPKGAPKDPDGSTVMALLRSFDDSDAVQDLSDELRSGRAGWADAKEVLNEVLDRKVEPVRRRFMSRRADEAHLESVLREGSARAREQAEGVLHDLRTRVGLGDHERRGRDAAAPAGLDKRLDAALAMTFPASDPVALTAGPRPNQQSYDDPTQQSGGAHR